MVLLRRFLVLVALMFWQGGFLFYVSVVVPVGTAVLGSALRQGFITQQVTRWLNVSAIVALLILAAEWLLLPDDSIVRRRLRAGCWLVMALCQAVLHYLHQQLSLLMQGKGRIVLDPEAFYPLHRVYLWTHTLQWFVALLFLGLTLSAWKAEDRKEVI